MLPCDICSRTGHSWFACPDRSKKPEGWKPDRLTKKGSTESAPVELRETQRRDGNGLRSKGKATIAPPSVGARESDALAAAPGITQREDDASPSPSIPEPKRGPGRPKSIEDMKAYKAQKARERRARQAAQKPAE